MSFDGSDHFGTTMAGGPDSARQRALKDATAGSIRREEDGCIIEEFDPDRAPITPKRLRRQA